MRHFALDSLHFAMGAPPPGTQQNPTGDMLKMLGMMGFFFVVMYFLMIRPQQKKQKDHQQMLKTLKAGDRVLTSGGVVGVVVSVKEKTVAVRSADTKLELLKSAVTEILERSGSESKAS
jgi:preprotein translocase subunit YajC